VDSKALDRERNVLADQARASGKPEEIIAKMVEGRLRNFFAEHVLAEQPFIKDEKKTVGAYANDHGMQVVRFVGWELGKE
jgi:elongation factor Ts